MVHDLGVGLPDPGGLQDDEVVTGGLDQVDGGGRIVAFAVPGAVLDEWILVGAIAAGTIVLLGGGGAIASLMRRGRRRDD